MDSTSQLYCQGNSHSIFKTSTSSMVSLSCPHLCSPEPQVVLTNAGPIIRISPEELHILDPSYWQSLYGGPEPRDKYEPMSIASGNPNNVFSTPSHHLHRLRRSALSAWFSKKQIHEVFEPAIKTKLDILCTRLAEYKNTGKVLHLDWAWPAFTGDIITKFAFDRCYHGLESPDFKDTLHQVTLAAVESTNLVFYFPWLVPLMESMPGWIVLKIQPCIHSLFKMQKVSSTPIRIFSWRI